MIRLKNIACGISGGVDSAVAALLLKKRGFNVTGVFMKNWDIADEVEGQCTLNQDLEDAYYVCKHLNIPLMEVNFVKEYWNTVFSEMLIDYERGTTPNPDVICNKHIKFSAFYDHAINVMGMDAIATGHYARSSAGEFLENLDLKKGVKLLKAIDWVKDQTLFLAQIPQRSLQRTIFPLGYFTKDIVKKIAESAGMERIARKKESMGICFIGSRNFSSFIEEYIPPVNGNFIDLETGKVVGQHKGVHYWTIGQRANIGGLGSGAFFIVDINSHTQDITVAVGTHHPALYTESMYTDLAHWIHEYPQELLDHQMMETDFRFQHKHPLVTCNITTSSSSPYCGHDRLIVTLSRPLRAITAGQFAVFYLGEECLGSARIQRPGPSLSVMNYKGKIVKDGFT